MPAAQIRPSDWPCLHYKWRYCIALYLCCIRFVFVITKLSDSLEDHLWNDQFFGLLVHIWHCPYSIQSRVYVTVRCLSVCLPQLFTTAAVCSRFAAVGPMGRRFQSIAAQLAPRSMVLSSKSDQYHVFSCHRRLYSDLIGLCCYVLFFSTPCDSWVIGYGKSPRNNLPGICVLCGTVNYNSAAFDVVDLKSSFVSDYCYFICILILVHNNFNFSLFCYMYCVCI